MDLSPCPFCGETTEFKTIGGQTGTPVAFVVCGTCHTRGPGGESVEQAKANWNRRPTSTLVDDVICPECGGADSRTSGGVSRCPCGNHWPVAIDVASFPTGIGPPALVEYDELAAARERRELAGLPSITTTADAGGLGMEFNMFGAPPPPKPPKR